jgi:hypothetical protein
MLMQVPFLGIISLVLLILINLLCACLAAIISAVVSHLFGDDVLFQLCIIFCVVRS